MLSYWSVLTLPAKTLRPDLVGPENLCLLFQNLAFKDLQWQRPRKRDFWIVGLWNSWHRKNNKVNMRVLTLTPRIKLPLPPSFSLGMKSIVNWFLCYPFCHPCSLPLCLHPPPSPHLLMCFGVRVSYIDHVPYTLPVQRRLKQHLSWHQRRYYCQVQLEEF